MRPQRALVLLSVLGGCVSSAPPGWDPASGPQRSSPPSQRNANAWSYDDTGRAPNGQGGSSPGQTISRQTVDARRFAVVVPGDDGMSLEVDSAVLQTLQEYGLKAQSRSDKASLLFELQDNTRGNYRYRNERLPGLDLEADVLILARPTEATSYPSRVVKNWRCYRVGLEVRAISAATGDTLAVASSTVKDDPNDKHPLARGQNEMFAEAARTATQRVASRLVQR